VAIGSAIFGASYSVTLIPGLEGMWRLDVPVVGPLLEIPHVGYGAGPIPAAMLAFDATIQAGGLVLVVVGAASRQLRLERASR
jgi:hypothetical protein